LCAAGGLTTPLAWRGIRAPGETKTAEPPAECRACRAGLGGADAVEPRWAKVIDVEIIRRVSEHLLPGLHAGAVSYGPVLNPAAELLSAYGNGPAEPAGYRHLVSGIAGTSSASRT
jgi:hypothetical protein